MRVIVLAIPLVLSVAPSYAQEAASAIERQAKAFTDAFNSGKVELLSAMYAETAMVLPPNTDMITGRAAIENYWQGAVKDGLRNLVLNTVTIEDHGRVATEVGRFAVEVPNGESGMKKVEGKYVTVWKKTDDGWKLTTDIWNENH